MPQIVGRTRRRSKVQHVAYISRHLQRLAHVRLLELELLLFARWLRLLLAPVMKLSTASTSHPSASSRSQRCDPRKPAPPVTTARLQPPPKYQFDSVT